ncbi:MAG TPA: hypothetical protein VG673_18160, partial [Actinomycetota bacterium]|nr:hypothetical protein [Actinomycetota bacterium]
MRVVLVGAEAASYPIVVGPGWIALEATVRWKRFRDGFHNLLVSGREPEIGTERAVAEKQTQEIGVERPFLAALQLGGGRHWEVPLRGAVLLRKIVAQLAGRLDIWRVAPMPTAGRLHQPQMLVV